MLEYLDYIYEPKKVNDPNYEGNAYFFGTNIVLDKLFKLGGDRLGKSILLEVGSEVLKKDNNHETNFAQTWRE